MTRSSRPAPAALNPGMALAGWLLVGPAVAYIAVFGLAPLGYGFYLSLTSYDPMSQAGPQFHGLAGYAEVLASPRFWSGLAVTLQYTAEVIPATVVLALLLALLANRDIPGIAIFRAVIYLPRIVSLVVVSMVWLWLYSRDGFFNYIGSMFGGGDTPWLTSPDYALHSLAAMRIWKALGGNTVIFLAGLQAVPKELYEAARVDGAGPWARFRYVTVPCLRPVFVYVLTVDIIYLMQSFAEMFLMTSGGPLDSTTTVNMLIYQEAFQFNRMGQASATAFTLFTIIFAFAFLSMKRIGGERKGQ